MALSIIQWASPSIDASSFREVKTVNSKSGVAIYEKATKNSTNLGQLPTGTLLTQYSVANGWAYVESPTKKGYVDASFLSTPAHKVKIASSKSGLVVKAAPTKNAKTVATLKYSMIVKDYGSVGGGWSFVQYGNVTGYVASTFIGNASTKTAYVNSGSGAVVRNIASPSGASVGTLTHGTKVTVYTTLAGWSFVKSNTVEGYVAASFLSATAPKQPQVTGGLLPKHDAVYEYYAYSDDEGITEYFNFNKISNSRILIDNIYDSVMMDYRVINNTMNITIAESLPFVIPLPLTVGKTWSGSIEGVPIYYTVDYIDGWVETDYMYYNNVVCISFTDSTGEAYGEIHLAPGYGVVLFELSDILELTLNDVF